MMACLPDIEARELVTISHDLGTAVLVEVITRMNFTGLYRSGQSDLQMSRW
jgi:indole-3-glycerol phosphate synthase